ncbi:MAG: hypothetical protein U0797_05510 [Gemmataceae bacterium]
MSRWRRRLAIVAALLFVALVGLRFFLRSGAAARLVASQLGDILETTATIGSLRAALAGDTVVRGLKLYNDGDDVPYLEADEVTVDVSLANAAAGKRLPDRIDVRGARLRLRFDREGKLLTRPPTLPQAGQLPRVRLRDLELTLAQDGRPPLTLRRAQVTLAPDGEENLSGEIDDPVLGRFGLSGRFGQGKLHLRLNHPSLPLTLERFRTLPFLPRALTRRLEAEGDVPLEVALWLGPEPPRCRYRVAFGPARVRLLQDDRPAFLGSGVGGVADGDDDGNVKFQETFATRDGATGPSRSISPTPGWTCTCAADLAFDPGKLTELPFVPPEVWKHVRGRAGRRPTSTSIPQRRARRSLPRQVYRPPASSASRLSTWRRPTSPAASSSRTTSCG